MSTVYVLMGVAAEWVCVRVVDCDGESQGHRTDIRYGLAHWCLKINSWRRVSASLWP